MTDLRTRSFISTYDHQTRIYYVEARHRWLFWEVWREVDGARGYTPEDALAIANAIFAPEPAPVYQLSP